MAVTFAPTRLSPALVDGAAAMLARALIDDPCLVYPLPDPAERARGVPLLMAMSLRLYLARGEVWTTPGPALGAALWRPPVAPANTPEDLAAAGMGEVASAFGPEAYARYQEMLAGFAEVRAPSPTRPCWQLSWLGVEPAEQGRGIGGTLVRHTASRADAEGAICRLYNFVPRNVAIYERLGFRVIDEITMAQTHLHLWTMEREPMT